MEPIRVLNVVGRMDRGGIETLIMNVYRHIDRSRVQFDFLAHYGKENADYNEEIRALGGRIYEMPVIKTTEKTYFSRFFAYRRALKRFFREHPEYRIVHGHMTNTAAIYMPIAKNEGRVTCCIAHSHMSKTQKAISPLTALGTDLLRRPVRRVATDYFSCSSAASLWLFRQADVDAGRVTLVKNGVVPAQFAYNETVRNRVREALGVEGKTVIGHVGRFFAPKNHDKLLEVFAVYHRRHPDSVLWMVGEGELQPAMEKKAEALGLGDSARFLGLRDDVDALMQGMDLFLMPSLHEGLPVVGIEAQAAGLPLVVSSAVTEEMDVTGHVRFVALDEPAEAWATVMEESLTSYRRADTTAAIRQAGYDVETTAAFLQEFYLKKHEEGCSAR